MEQPEFKRGDEVVVYDPCGQEPTSGPYTVVGLAIVDDVGEVYLLETKSGEQQLTDSFEMVTLERWLEWLAGRAN